MSEQNNVFESKKERNDFYIAIGVILLFGFFILRFMGCDAISLDQSNLPIITESVEEIADRDGDGIADTDDKCPDRFGLATLGGCPADSDGDGIYDEDDDCPNYTGTLANKGCPMDSDGDGVHDGIDKCIQLAGVVENDGCPADSDGDGVYDVDDKCPNLAGVPENNGCPKVQIAEEDMTILQAAMKSVEFETGKATLKGPSTKVLSQVAATLKKYPQYKLSIEGHTDNVGDANANLQLSKARAKSCHDYLVQQGVKSYRMSHSGYGQSRPIADNGSADGRQTNRRVEFSLNY